MREAVGETVALATPAPCLSRKGQTLCHYAGADRDARATEATPASYPLRPMGHSEYNGTASPATLNRPTRHGDTETCSRARSVWYYGALACSVYGAAIGTESAHGCQQ